MKRRSREGTTSVVKALDVLLCFSPEEPELGVSEIARRLGMGVSTAHRLLASLRRREFVRQNPDTAKYSLGYRVVHLASTVITRSSVRAASLHHMLSLRDATGETCRLHLMSGRERICIEEVSSAHEPHSGAALGRAFPLYVGPAGHVILAHLPNHDARQILDEALRAGTLPLRERARVERLLDGVRLAGHAMGPEPGPNGAQARSLAVPIRNFTGAVVGALSVDGPSARWHERRMLSFVGEVVEDAAAISRQLGYAGRATQVASTRGSRRASRPRRVVRHEP